MEISPLLSKLLVPDMTAQALASFHHLLVELAKTPADFSSKE